MSTPSATPQARPGVTMLGLGAMGSALASRLLDNGYDLTVWNRSPGKGSGLVDRGAHSVEAVADAVAANPIIVACLFRHSSVHDTLDPVVDRLSGRTLVNLTTTTPSEARKLAEWAAQHSIAYLDGAILAVPDMIGLPAAQIFYSGSQTAFENHRDVFAAWGTSSYDGSDAGMASLIDLAMLSGMYQLFAGFFHGAALVESEGMTAAEFAARATPFLSAMTESLTEYAAIIDSRDYAAPGQQSLEFSDLSHIVRASNEQGVNSATLASVQALISQQIDAGHASEGFARIFESMRATPGTAPARLDGRGAVTP